MKKISFMKNRLRQFVLSFCLALGLASATQAQVGISIVTTQNGTEVIADLLAYNFTDMVSMQYTMQWDPTQLQFVGTQDFNLPGMSGANFGANGVEDGVLLTSWFDNTVSGITIPPCGSLYRVKFELIGSYVPDVIINSSPLMTEFVNVSAMEVPFIANFNCEDIGSLSGNVFYDENNDCTSSAGESGLENWIVQIEGNGDTFFQSTDADGNFDLFLPEGNYDLTLTLPASGYWGACSVTQNLDIVQDENTDAFFAAQALVSCTDLSVDISAPFLRRCFSSNYYIDFCNQGTIDAEDAYVEVEFDEHLSVVTSSIPWTTVDGNTYTFPVGDVPIGQCGSFAVEVIVSCEVEIGLTHCSQATIFPNDPCNPTSPLWDGSSLIVNGECDGDEVLFTITNVGSDMQEATEFIIFEDDMMALPPAPVNLTSLESMQVSRPANGLSYRMEVEQSANHPGLSRPSVSVEGCVDGSTDVSVGFAGQFPEDDLDPWVDIDCQENIGSWDPNDKIGYPLGYGPEHFIEPGTEIEYRIRFQNTGTDTAFNITVLDTLSSFLDPSSVRPGASSHPYEFELTGEGVLKFDFPWILLPDSTTNLEGSNGFVKFKISPRGNVPLGTKIENSAAIYFDFNQPVITNTYFHTVEEDFYMQQEPNAVGNIPISDVQVALTPNPSPAGRRPTLLMDAPKAQTLQFQIFNLEGKNIFSGKNNIQKGRSLVTLPHRMGTGAYLLQVTDEQGHGTTLKMLVR